MPEMILMLSSRDRDKLSDEVMYLRDNHHLTCDNLYIAVEIMLRKAYNMGLQIEEEE